MTSRFLRFSSVCACLGALVISSQPIALADETNPVLAALNTALHDHYVFPDTADEVTREVGEFLTARPRSERDTPEELAEVLAEALIEATGDLHFAVGADADWVTMARDQNTGEEALYQQDLAWEESTNHGLHSVAVLEGNVGYLRFDYFPDPQKAYDALTASMAFLEHADALIIDLRYNRGGYMETGQLLSSYLFDNDATVSLLDMTYNEDGRRFDVSHWVLPALPGPRHPDIPVAILTGATTFSAAEWMALSLHELGRATLIGDVTAGGAHPVDRFVLTDDLWIQIPIGQIRGPVSGTDFEGVGVQPDTLTPSRDALTVAHAQLLTQLAESQDDPALDWLAPLLNAQAHPVTLTPAQLEQVVGRYEGRELILEDGDLVYRWRDRFTLALTPLTETLFAVEGGDGYRIEIIKERDQVTGLRLIEKSGHQSVYDRLP